MPRFTVPKVCAFPPVCLATGSTEDVVFEPKTLHTWPRWLQVAGTISGFVPVLAMSFASGLPHGSPQRRSVLSLSFWIMVLVVLFVVRGSRSETPVELSLPFSRSASARLKLRRRLGSALTILLVVPFLAYALPAIDADVAVDPVPLLVSFVALLAIVWGYRILVIWPCEVRAMRVTDIAVELEVPSAAAVELVRAAIEGRGRGETLPPGTRCASHDGNASFACSRCGDFVCVECAPPVAGVALLCQPCRERLRDEVRARAS